MWRSTNHSEFASLKKVARMKLGVMEVRNGSTDFVREVTKDEHADDCSGESDGSQRGTIVVIVEPAFRRFVARLAEGISAGGWE
jgi:hypothetical protein